MTVWLLIATALAAWFGARQVSGRSADQLTERSEELAATIDRRVDTYLEKLYGIRGFMQVEPRASRRDFEAFLAEQRLGERYRGALSVGFAQVTSLDDRQAFIDRVGADAERSALPYPRFSIRPNAEQSLSVVVTYVHPVSAAPEAFGFDLLSEPARRAAVTRARERAEAVATAPLTFVTERENEQGALMMLPLYGGPDQRPPGAERRTSFSGVAYAALRFPDLLGGLVGEDDDLELYDVGSVQDPLPARLRVGDEAFDLRGGPDAPGRDVSESRVQPLVTAGRRWRIYFRPAGNLVSAGERAVPWLIAGFGLLVSLLAGSVVQALSSSRRRAEALVEQRTEELRRSNEELERFAFIASHDLQQPLRTVSGFLQLLERQAADHLDEAAKEFIEHALRGTKQMGTLIDDLLAYSRVTRDDRPMGPVPLDEVLDAALEQLRASLGQSGARVTREELPVVHGDRGQLVQVFANLIGNGVKYRGEATPEVHVSSRRLDGDWEIAVQDNGIGIDPKHHARIFEMFRRLHTEEEFEGTGVGLALVKRIVEHSGGSIRVESEPGHGSRFVLRLAPGERVVRRGR